MDRDAGGAAVQVTYQNPEQFTDMARAYPAGEGADQGYMREFERYVERVGANRLPSGYTLTLTILDVDMAGDFEPHRGPDFADIRLVKQIYPPRIHLEYRLTGPAGEVVSEGERRLSDTAFDWRLDPTDRNDPLRHEKALIDSFLRDLAQQV